jgi:hypothetical protein
MDHLLSPAQDLDACLRDLQSVFADMGIHHIALMEGISLGGEPVGRQPRVQFEPGAYFGAWYRFLMTPS